MGGRVTQAPAGPAATCGAHCDIAGVGRRRAPPARGSEKVTCLGLSSDTTGVASALAPAASQKSKAMRKRSERDIEAWSIFSPAEGVSLPFMNEGASTSKNRGALRGSSPVVRAEI